MAQVELPFFFLQVLDRGLIQDLETEIRREGVEPEVYASAGSWKNRTWWRWNPVGFNGLSNICAYVHASLYKVGGECIVRRYHAGTQIL